MNFGSIFDIKEPEKQSSDRIENATAVAEKEAPATGGLRGEAKVMAYFEALGIQQSEIIPRVNVLTFDGWIQKGRVVKKGSHGCRLEVFKRVPKQIKDAAGNIVSEKTVTKMVCYWVFHITQTEVRK